jgi:hypothetical protein
VNIKLSEHSERRRNWKMGVNSLDVKNYKKSSRIGLNVSIRIPASRQRTPWIRFEVTRNASPPLSTCFLPSILTSNFPLCTCVIWTCGCLCSGPTPPLLKFNLHDHQAGIMSHDLPLNTCINLFPFNFFVFDKMFCHS